MQNTARGINGIEGDKNKAAFIIKKDNESGFISKKRGLIMTTKRIEKGNVRIIAHRGLSGLEQENTTQAFVAAGNRSYYGIETDIHLTADNNFIVIHDNNTMRVTGIDRVVEKTDFATLREMKVMDVDGSTTRNDLRLPTLEEYILICKRYEKVCVLELKNHMLREQVWRIMDIFSELAYLDHTVFISFDFENLVFVREKAPDQEVQFLTDKLNDEIFEKVKENRFDIDIYHRALTEDAVARFHEAGILVNCWTVNHHSDAARLISWGVDFITSNIIE